MSLQDRRQAYLNKFFQSVLVGDRTVNNANDAKLFLEALRTQPSPSLCVEYVSFSQSGIDALRKSVRTTLDPDFILSNTIPFLSYISDPTVKAVADGQLLQDILLAIAHPVLFWNALLTLFTSHSLPETALETFAWLALELVSLPPSVGVDFRADGEKIVEDGTLAEADDPETRTLHYKLENALRLRPTTAVNTAFAPGRRHDNDFEDFRKIAIYPTVLEFLSTEPPFYRQAKEVMDADVEDRPAIYLDNQYRLLREDMLQELREDFQVAVGRKKGSSGRVTILDGLRLVDIWTGEEWRWKACSLAVCCENGIERLPKENTRRKTFLEENKWFLKHQAFGVLCSGSDILAPAFLDRDKDAIMRDLPALGLQFTDEEGLKRALIALKAGRDIRFILVDTPVFAYEPILKGLKEITELPLQDVLVSPSEVHPFNPPEALRNFVYQLDADTKAELPVMSVGNKSVAMDKSQVDSLASALLNQVSLIQGPPGTGKSFIGSQVIKVIHEHTKFRVLVITYTHHALDDALSHFLDVGIPKTDIVRLGNNAKATERTSPLALKELSRGLRGTYRRTSAAHNVVGAITSNTRKMSEDLKRKFTVFNQAVLSFDELCLHWEFSEDEQHFLEAFTVPEEEGWSRAGPDRDEIGPQYLFDRWCRGKDAGIFTEEVVNVKTTSVWDLSPAEREERRFKWNRAIIEEKAATIKEAAKIYNSTQNRLERLSEDREIHVLLNKRIIGCTTSAAAKYHHLIKAANPDMILVEEAGEILESHILTALTPSVKQLVLIGDHKQLRPKINNYMLTVEQGSGYDLNRSMFERLILQGMPHTMLRKQHRSHPEISANIREMTYPDLEDGERTLTLEKIRGLNDRVIFVNHSIPEDDQPGLAERRDPTIKASKRNMFEAEMILKFVKYLGQQGYGTDDMVVLTPYLGQLYLLRSLLSTEHDPWLNDLDSFDLIRAGIMPESAGRIGKKLLRLSTVDNYQGEECDIVIVSLTRSNANSDIGFLSAPERVNVLLSRARKCLIMIGNMETFLKSRKGGKTWTGLLEHLKVRNHIYDGFPIFCERHPEKKAILKSPVDFGRYAPDGGCSEPCDALLPCQQHKCKLRCHQLADHSQMPCTERMERTCDKGHSTKLLCGRQAEICRKCKQENDEIERRIKRDNALEAERLRREEEYKRDLQEIQNKIDHERRKIKYANENEQQEKDLARYREELVSLKATVQNVQDIAQQDAQNAQGTVPQPAAKFVSDLTSAARDEWEHLKKFEGAKSAPMDELMDMIGLEDVKTEFLNIKSKVDTAVRQGIALKSERFSCSLLGNPGTGKTTVARLYGKFLLSVGILPGSCFKETTGAALANQGVNGCQKLIDDILNNGGGVLFIDEVYQLTLGQNPGGDAILDYLLPEVENLTGKVVFVLAGYNKQMESFFAYNPGLPSRFPIEMKFADYTDDELLRILELNINKRYSGRMEAEGGLRGLYCRIVIRRIGRGRGKEGFGNARTVENVFAHICERQAVRMRRCRREGIHPNDMLFTKEDLIGPEPAEALQKCEGWKKLQELIGLKAVKEAVRKLVDGIQENYQRELNEQPLIEYSLNKVFLGNPGTGKTTVAKLYGRILAEIGLLSKGEVVVTNPFMLSQSEATTKGILALTVGKVLVIDEAYGLYAGGNSQGSISDPYKTAVIDTIVAEVQSVPGDDRCVLLLGYRDQMENMFQNVNPGLSRRFPLSTAFEFEDFDQDDLREILEFKLKASGYKATNQAKNVAMEMLDRARNRSNFSNGKEVDIILDIAKARHQRRRLEKVAKYLDAFEACDFDPDFDRTQRSDTDVKRLFEGVVGCEEIIAKLQGYQQRVKRMKELDLDPKEAISFNFLFRGPPGTGKTSTAQKIGKVFYDMGFLAEGKVEECSATDLVGQYAGQTGPKVQQMLDKGLGRVLFIDEAYRLIGERGSFASEAMDEIMDTMTKAKYQDKMVIILAGYDHQINELMSMNPGLTYRFPESINFPSLRPGNCVTLLTKELQKKQALLQRKGHVLNLSAVETPSSEFVERVEACFATLARQTNWANARDVLIIAKNIWSKTIKSEGDLAINEQVVESELQALIAEREHRANVNAGHLAPPELAPAVMNAPPPPEPTIQTATSTSQNVDTPKTEPEDQKPRNQQPKEVKTDTRPQIQQNVVKRDAGVSDEVWEQLEQDKQKANEQEQEYQELLRARATALNEERGRTVKKLLEEEERRKKETALQARLKTRGLCPMGYVWIKQAGGYRCAGGSHWLPDTQVAQLCGLGVAKPMRRSSWWCDDTELTGRYAMYP